MKIDSIDREATLYKVRETLVANPSLDSSIKRLIELLILVISLLCNRLKIDSKNSSKPLSQDPNRQKKPKNTGSRKPVGQEGHNRTTLQKVKNPDHIVKLSVDRTKLPKGDYKRVGYQSR